MTVDATARRANVKDSIKKFFVDNLYTVAGVHLSFDTSLATPKISGRELDRWIVVRFGSMDLNDGSLILHVYCCTRKDNEGFRLAQLTDTVMDYLTDSTEYDGIRRVPLYRSRQVGAWSLLDGGFMILVQQESEELDADDRTKYIAIDTIWRWGTKI